MFFVFHDCFSIKETETIPSETDVIPVNLFKELTSTAMHSCTNSGYRQLICRFLGAFLPKMQNLLKTNGCKERFRVRHLFRRNVLLACLKSGSPNMQGTAEKCGIL
jgi:hypothetical protein